MSRSTFIRTLPSLVLAIIAVCFVWMAYEYDLASRSLPWIAGVLAILLALIDIVSSAKGPLTHAPSEPSTDPSQRVGEPEVRAAAPQSPLQEATAFAWIGGFLPLVVVLGFYGAIPLYIFCYLRLYAAKGALVSALTALGVVGSLYLVFEVFMGYAIFSGLLGGDSL